MIPSDRSLHIVISTVISHDSLFTCQYFSDYKFTEELITEHALSDSSTSHHVADGDMVQFIYIQVNG